MALRTIVTEPDELLRKRSRPVEKFDERLWQLLDDMKDTLIKADGVGLAAVQVGILRRVFIVMLDDKVYEFINPEILSSEGEQEGFEGCLSFPGVHGIIKRPNVVKMRAQNRNGEWFEITGEALFARAMCHENDHLDGHVIRDRADRLYTEAEIDEMMEQEDAE